MPSVAPLPSDVAYPTQVAAAPSVAKRKLSTPLLSALSLGAFALLGGAYLLFLEPCDERSMREAQVRALANQQKLAPTEIDGAVSGSALEAKITADPAGPAAPSAR